MTDASTGEPGGDEREVIAFFGIAPTGVLGTDIDPEGAENPGER